MPKTGVSKREFGVPNPGHGVSIGIKLRENAICRQISVCFASRTLKAKALSYGI